MDNTGAFSVAWALDILRALPIACEKPTVKSMESFLENLLYASRWLLAPIYLGLSLALLALAMKFFQAPAAPRVRAQ